MDVIQETLPYRKFNDLSPRYGNSGVNKRNEGRRHNPTDETEITPLVKPEYYLNKNASACSAFKDVLNQP